MRLLVPLYGDKDAYDGFDYGVIDIAPQVAARIVEIAAILDLTFGKHGSNDTSFYRAEFFAGDAVTVHFASDEIEAFIAGELGEDGAAGRDDLLALPGLLEDGYLTVPDGIEFPVRNYDGEPEAPRIELCTFGVGLNPGDVIWRFVQKHCSDYFETPVVSIADLMECAAESGKEAANGG